MMPENRIWDSRGGPGDVGSTSSKLSKYNSKPIYWLIDRLRNSQARLQGE